MTAINVRPIVYADRKYVYATSRRIVMSKVRDMPVQTCDECMTRAPQAPSCSTHMYLDSQAVMDLVDQLLDECDVRIATIPGIWGDGRDSEIQAFIAQDKRDKSIEFLHLREIFSDMGTSDLGAAVVRALIGEMPAEVIARRHPSYTTMSALVSATNGHVVVRPRAI